MKTQLDLEGAPAMKLESAILIYGNDGYQGCHIGGVRGDGKAQAVATIHKIKDGQLQSGQPLDMKALRSIFERNAKGDTLTDCEFIPESILAKGPSSLVWWKPAHVAPIFFQGDNAKLRGISGMKVSHPSLIFRTNGKSLTVFALKGSERPTLKTKLYEPPYWNIFDSRDVCLPHGGSIAPKNAELPSIDAWQSVFFDSSFSHPGGGGGTKFPGGHNALWLYLAKRRKKRFPDWSLLPTKNTLEDLIDETED